MKKLIAILLLFFAVTTHAQSNGVTWKAVGISADTLTSTLDLEGDNLKLVGIFIDNTDWVTANLTMESYNPLAQKWGTVTDVDGADYTITVGAITAPVDIILPPVDMAGFEKVRFKSSALQDSSITIYPKVRAY